MDDHDHPDTNVVNLHRRDDLDSRRREQIARTIFAEEDEIYTFSQGNLVPPSPVPPTQERESPEDPFFEEQLRRQRPTADATAATVPGQQRSETDAYFEQLASQSAAEMARGLHRTDDEPEAGPAGVSLTPDAVSRASRARRRRPPVRWRLTGRRAAVSLGLSTSVALLATALLVLATVSRGTPAASAGQAPTGPAMWTGLNRKDPFAPLRSSASTTGKTRLSAEHASKDRSKGADRRSRPAKRTAHHARADNSQTQHHASRSAGTTEADMAGQQTTDSETVSSPPPPTAPATSNYSPSTNSSSSANSAKTTRVFGFGGELGPGHSSIG